MKQKITSNWRVIVLIFTPFLIFFKVLTGNTVAVGDFSGSDLLDLHYPFRYLLHQAISNFQLQLWTSQLSLGMPILAEGQTGIFFMPNLLLTFISPLLSVNFSIIFVFVIAGLSAYLYFRELKYHQNTALIGALTFAFSAFFITRIKHLNMVNSAAIFPLLLFTTKRYLNTGKWWWIIINSVVGSQIILAGHAQMAFYIGIFYLFYLIFGELVSNIQQGNYIAIPRLSKLLLISSITIAGLISVQILPTLELLQYTPRSQFNYNTITAYPYHPRNLLTFISPYYFGNPAIGTYTDNINTYGIFWENASYIGLISLILIVYSIFNFIKNPRKHKQKVFWLFTVIVCIFLMLGDFTPIFKSTLRFVPGLDLFRFPTRFNLFLIFSMIILAMSGLEELIANLGKHHIRKTYLIVGGLILIDLYIFLTGYIGYLSVGSYQKSPWVTDYISDAGEYRIYSLTQYSDNPYGVLGWKNSSQSLLDIRQAIPANQHVLYGYSSFSDRAWFEGGLGLERRNRVENFLLKENTNVVTMEKILGAFNVKYLISFNQLPGITIEKIKEFSLSSQFNQTLKLYRNGQVMPRIYYVPEAEVFNHPDELFKQLINPEYLPIRTVLLEDQPKNMPEKFGGALIEFQNNNPVNITLSTDNQVVIQADIQNHGFLVLSDTFYPGWKVKIDGQPGKILPANYLVRAVELFPGQHQIELSYQPESYRIGSIITWTTILIILSVSALIYIKQIRVGKKITKTKPIK